RSFSRKVAGAVACTTMVAALGLSVVAFFQLLDLPPEMRWFDVTVAQWIPSIPLQLRGGAVGLLQVDWGFRLDPLAGMMILVVTGIGTLIHVYSTAYMADEPRGGVARFFCYLNLFCFFMLMLVLGNNFLVMFVGWEGVGLCSYLLIGYWYEKTSASDAGTKSFITNGGGDGDRRRLHGGLQRRALLPRADGDGDRRHRRRADGADGGVHRARAVRHQTRARVLDGVAARLHVHGDGRRGVFRRRVPSDD